MITKNQFAWMIVNNYIQENEYRGAIENLESHVPYSSSLAVALLHLNLIKTPYLKEYAETRSGTILLGNTSPPNKERELMTLSVCDVLSVLPE